MTDLTPLPRHFPTEDPEREDRIHDAALVDAYDEEEITAGWYYYLEETLHFPFTAVVFSRRRGNALISRQVRLLRMAHQHRCSPHQMWVLGVPEPAGDPVHFFLSDIHSVAPHPDRETALADWLYWTRHQPDEFSTP